MADLWIFIGTLDKFIGDAGMCFWKVPLDVKEHQQLEKKAAGPGVRTGGFC